MRHAILVNPQLVLVSGKPCRVRLDGLAIDEERWRRGLIPHFQIQFMFTLRHEERLGLSELQLSV